MRINTKVLHSGYTPENGGTHVLPIYQSTTYRYDSTEHVGKLFDLAVPGHMYSRISNPTVVAVEDKIADLEGGVGALCVTSGQMANFLALTNILGAGDHVVSSPAVYGGTINLLAVTMKRLGIEVTFIDARSSEEELSKAFRPNTKAMFGETIANPAIDVLDIEKFARVAHRHGVPLIVDNTFATPVLCRPFEFGADIVTHSSTKYMDGHAIQVGGVIVDRGNFDWANGNYPLFTEPDESYHGIVYTDYFGKSAYINKARFQMVRDLGVYPSAQDAWLMNLGLETLPLRMERHCKNADIVARYFDASDKVEYVKYPTLPSHPDHELVKKYLPNGCSGVLSVVIKGGREGAVRFLDSLKLASIVVHVADIRTCVLHPASATHRQLTEEQLVAAGVTPGLIRFSCGCEDIDDILEDIEQALKNV
ncbi:MAG: aminotransferase class I/II-fold pyridoxal phosphate-dependent enzyme [Clostridiales bacterium]|nr:aminotransferase class I/II-fold pyridoxal phosphate-dependent enzyme [Clostridiales bacterium]